MMRTRVFLGVTVLAASVFVLRPAGLASDKIADDAKVYQTAIEAMKGQGPRAVLNKLESWKFEPMVAWMADTSASKDFKKFNKGKTKFSKQELAEIFEPAGKFKIAVYGLMVATDSATTGSVDQFGMGSMKDASHNLQIFTVIRIVFRDEKLIDVRTWPKMENSEIAGGTWRIR
jgi:hypothetical protein